MIGRFFLRYRHIHVLAGNGVTGSPSAIQYADFAAVTPLLTSCYLLARRGNGVGPPRIASLPEETRRATVAGNVLRQQDQIVNRYEKGLYLRYPGFQ
jgi:hypothetical protein